MVSDTEGESGRVGGDAGPTDGALPAQPVIQRFGGIRPMAQKLGVPVSTVQGWKERGAIPPNRREEVLAAAARHNIVWEPGDLTLTSMPPMIETAAEPAVADSPEPDMPPEEPATASRESDAEPTSAAWGSLEPETQRATDEPAPSETWSPTPGHAQHATASTRPGLLPALLGSALIALLISASAPWWTRAVGLAPAAAPAGVPGVAARIDALDRRIAELEGRPAGAPADAGLVQRLGALEQQNRQLRSDLDRVASAAAAAPAGAADPAAGQRIEAVSGEIAALRDEIQAVRRDAAQAVAPERLDALSGRIEENAAELRAMQGDLSRLVDLPKRVQDLGSTIEAASGQTQHTALILASGQLEAALDSGQPYASQLGAVRRLAADDADLSALLAQLEEHADEGTPSMAELRIRFADTALAIAQAAQSDADGDWADRAWARLRSLVTVRPVGGDVAGESAEAHVARAEARLNEGDLASAIGELEGLEGAAAEAAAPWLAGARARLSADQAIERLRERALARILPDGAME
jgi:hypothetical protein